MEEPVPADVLTFINSVIKKTKPMLADSLIFTIVPLEFTDL